MPENPETKKSGWKKIFVGSTIIVIIVVLGVGGLFVYNNYFSKEQKEESSPQKTKSVQLGLQKEATHLSKVADTKGAYWMRGGWLYWNSIEPEKGKFDWEFSDNQMKEMQAGEVYLLPVIFPYASWDQEACHPEKKYVANFDPGKGGQIKVGKPCDMVAYENFLTKIVERYDGDGKDDMPGLKIPIKYWEIMNEPSMQGGSTGGMGEELKFFVGAPAEYVEILKASYETIKKADPAAKVLHAGMAGMHKNFVDFWTPIFESGAGKYFDIANIHSISTNESTEDLYLIRFKRFLKKFSLEGKPIWVTEAQYGDLQNKPDNIQEFDKLVARSAVFALAQGADKLFFIDNWTFWDQQEGAKPPEDEEGKDKGPKPKLNLSNNTTHKVYLNLVDKINSFDKVETLNEKYHENVADNEGATTDIGHYKFINGNKVVYVLWGENSAVAPEITGKLKVTDIYGESKEIDSSNLKPSDSPVFVELKK